MRWQGREQSENVEDRRGTRAKKGVALGGVGGLIVIVLALLLKVDPNQLLQNAGQGGGGDAGADQEYVPASPEEEKLAEFSRVILRDTEVIWGEQFRLRRKQYVEPTLVLFTGEVNSACGFAEAAVGPFYCPGDSKVYIDVGFYADMQKQLDAPGEFARAYVIAHEVGHHVQRLLGYAKLVDDARRNADKVEANNMSVRLELQADFLAGVWAHHAQEKYDFLEKGDIESAMNAAFQIGDDRLQSKSRGQVVPDSFTHGTSKQRMRWFRTGLEKGDLDMAAELFELDYEDL